MKFKNKLLNAVSYLIYLISPPRKISYSEVLNRWNNGMIKRVLFVRQNQGIGDMILFTPVIASLKKSRKDTEIDLIASSYNYVAVKTNPFISKIYIWSKSNIFKNISIILEMRKRRYDLAVVVSSHTSSFTSFLYAKLSGSKIIIGYKSHKPEGALWSRYMSDIEIPPAPNNISEIDKFAGLIAPLSVKSDGIPQFYIPDPVIKEMKKIYELKSKPHVGLFLGGNSKRTDRIWNAESWAEVIIELGKRNIRTICIVPPADIKAGGGNKEKILYDEVCKITGEKLDFFSDKDIIKTAGFIKNLKVFISPDGGIFHISVAVRVNTIGIFIKTDSKRWAPSLPWVYPIQSYNGTPEGIKPSDVVKTAVNILTTACDL